MAIIFINITTYGYYAIILIEDVITLSVNPVKHGLLGSLSFLSLLLP